MAVLVGIDEAGYGPLLGPLVVSSVAFSMPEDLLRADHWKLLSRAVAREKKNLAGRLLVADSKKAYNRTLGLDHLRRTVLAAAATLPRCKTPPQNAGQLLALLNSPCGPHLDQYPWYASFPDKPLAADPAAVQLASTVLANTLSARRIDLLDITSRVTDVAAFNRMVSAVRNKAGVLFTIVSGLIADAFSADRAPDPVQIIVDRQGGRTDYVPVLRKMFPDLDLRVIRQDENLASYELTGRGRAMRLHFAVKADDRFLPVALASMVSKYVRELFVESLNDYFQKHCTGIRPTAGYWKDGQRFIKELQSHPQNPVSDPQTLIRLR